MAADFHPYVYQKPGIQHLLSNDDAALFLSPGMGKTVITLTSLRELILDGASRGALIVAPIRVCKITWPNQVAAWNHTKWMKVANMRSPEGEARWRDGGADIYLINSEKLSTLERLVKCPVCKGQSSGDCERCEIGMSETKQEDGSVLRKAKKEVGAGYLEMRYPQFTDRFLATKKELPVDTLVVDELSLAKSHSSTRFNSMRPWIHDHHNTKGELKFKTSFKRRWGLTGTPAPNSYLNLHPQIRLLDDGKRLGRPFTGFRDRFFKKADREGYRFEILPGSKEIIDSAISDMALVMLGDDWLDLPTCNTEDIDIDLPKDAAKAYATLERDMLVQLETGEIEALTAAALSNKLLQITAGCAYDKEKDVHIVHDAKLDALRKIRKAHPREPLLVLTSYVSERERVLKAFPEARQFHEKDLPLWQAGKIKMWVTDARSISHGIDGLQKSGRIAVWMTPTYSWETYTQTNARLVRTGQSQETIVYRILARDTLDWAVAEVLRTKEEGNSGLMQALKALQQLKKAA